MPTLRIPFVGSITNRNETPVANKDQIFQECYPEIVKNQVTGQGRIYLNKRPGASASSAVSASALGLYGGCVWNSNSAATSPVVFSFLKSGGTATQVFNTALTQIGGDIANTNQCAVLTDTVVGTTGNLVGYFADNGTNALEAWFFPEGGAWTQITDADFPPNLGTPEPLIGSPAHMDGYMFVMTTNGKIWNSDLNSVSAWTATSFLTAQSMPDGGMGLARYKNLIVGFGKYSTEFFYNAGNATGSPLSPIANALIRIGAFQSTNTSKIRCIFPFGNTVYWVGVDSESGRRAIYRLNGYQAEKISNAYIDKALNDPSRALTTLTGFTGAFTAHGMAHIVLALGSIFAIYCVDTGMWWLSTGAFGVNNCMVGLASSSYGTDNSAAFIYTISGSTYDDAGSAITQTVQTEPLDFGTGKRKVFHSLRLIGDTRTEVGVGSVSNVAISWSDDDYVTFTTPVNVNMFNAEKIIYRLGSARRRAFKFTHAEVTPNRMEAFEMDYEVGPH